jgi:hypothetical protein
MVLVTINIHGFSLYYLLFQLPGLSAIRAVTRIVLVLLFPLAIITGRVIDIGWSLRSRRHILVGAPILAACALLVIEAAMIKRTTSSLDEWQGRLESLNEQVRLPIRRDTVLAVKPGPGTEAVLRQVDAMLLAQRLNVQTLNGYSGHGPPGWRPMLTCSDVDWVLRRGEEFRRKLGDTSFRIDASRLVAIGFGECTSLLSGNAIGQ